MPKARNAIAPPNVTSHHNRQQKGGLQFIRKNTSTGNRDGKEGEAKGTTHRLSD